MTEHLGPQKTEVWLKGLVDNMARSPKGGDTDQIKAVAAGECGVAISNSYYYVRLLASDKAEDRKVIESIGLVWPNQKSFGTHMNVSGAGVVKYAKNRDAAVKYLEYLASDAAQGYFAEGNNEWPVVKGAPLNNKALASLGTVSAHVGPGRVHTTVHEGPYTLDVTISPNRAAAPSTASAEAPGKVLAKTPIRITAARQPRRGAPCAPPRR